VYHPDPKQGTVACGCSTCYNHMLLYLITETWIVEACLNFAT